ncbi:MAG: hypothetical protein GX347_06030 [Epulopiscium sp.]|mgnify:CR=1 FL=1|nr:hypothetical protein [Candidatus Epulonipiscium sp.]
MYLQNVKKQTNNRGFILVELAIGIATALVVVLFLHRLCLTICYLNQEAKYKMEAHFIAQQYMERIKATGLFYDEETQYIDIKDGWEISIVLQPIKHVSNSLYAIGLKVSREEKNYMSLVSMVIQE